MPHPEEALHKFPHIFLPVLLAVVIVLLYLIPLFAMSMRGKDSGPGIWAVFSVVALLITIISPLIYGWKTHDTKGEVLIGLAPFLFVMTIPRILSGEIPRDMESLVRLVFYVVPLSAIGGLEGYFASQNEDKSLLFAIITSPVTDEWVIDVSDGWHKPSAVWQSTITMVPATAPLYVSVVPSWDSSGNLITRSYVNYP